MRTEHNSFGPSGTPTHFLYPAALQLTASRNRWLTKIARDLRLVVHAFSALRETTAFLTAGRAEETHREHLECVRLLESRDAEALREWMVAHVRNGRESVLGFLSV